MNDRHAIPTPARARLGFTLAELIVSVAAVALLTVGIGQIFSSVGRLVGTGSALAETDQYARAIEQQLRADFDSLTRMRADDTFIAIRSRVLGDANGNNSLDTGEKAIYLNADDRDADRTGAVSPYALSSRAITVRLDEMMFITSADGRSSTAQRFLPNSDNPASTDFVRIYYGHGLRPALDRSFDVFNPGAGADGNTPPRVWLPDGDFGDFAGADNRFAQQIGAPAAYQKAQGRNEFAGQWLLLRQPLYLSGGLVAGYGTFGSNVNRAYWSYSPFIRGTECVQRGFPGWGGAPLDDLMNATPTPNYLGQPGGPYPRVLYHGRTDLCAQGFPEVKRWLEGLAPNDSAHSPPPPAQAILPDASAFTGGYLDDYLLGSGWDPFQGDFFPTAQEKVDAPLWQRVGTMQHELDIDTNARRLRSVIAGCFARFQADDTSPLVDRHDSLAPGGSPAVPTSMNPEPPFASYMDMHAVLASRVSSFEIAWSDGMTWDYNEPHDRNNDGDTLDPDDLHRGDTIWYDFDFTRLRAVGNTGRSLEQADIAGIYGLASEDRLQQPEVFPGKRQSLLDDNAAQPGYYDARLTGADPDPEGAHEYLAIFPFRKFQSTGADYEDRSVQKPTRIRVRMTIHDAQFRIVGGRRYEFEFSIDLK